MAVFGLETRLSQLATTRFFAKIALAATSGAVTEPLRAFERLTRARLARPVTASYTLEETALAVVWAALAVTEAEVAAARAWEAVTGGEEDDQQVAPARADLLQHSAVALDRHHPVPLLGPRLGLLEVEGRVPLPLHDAPLPEPGEVGLERGDLVPRPRELADDAVQHHQVELAQGPVLGVADQPRPLVEVPPLRRHAGPVLAPPGAVRQVGVPQRRVQRVPRLRGLAGLPEQPGEGVVLGVPPGGDLPPADLGVVGPRPVPAIQTLPFRQRSPQGMPVSDRMVPPDGGTTVTGNRRSS